MQKGHDIYFKFDIYYLKTKTKHVRFLIFLKYVSVDSY